MVRVQIMVQQAYLRLELALHGTTCISEPRQSSESPEAFIVALRVLMQRYGYDDVPLTE